MNNRRFTLRGQFKLSVVGADGNVLWNSRWMPNLILNDGMDRIAADSICNCFLYGIAGTSSEANSAASGDTEASTSGATVTLSGGDDFEFDTGSPGDVGNVIKWDDTGFEGRITAVAAVDQATISPTPSMAQSGAFVVYKTNQTGLVAETKRSADYVRSAPFNESVLDGFTLTHTRTFDFPRESETVLYREFGVGWSLVVGAANTTFARMILDPAVSVIPSQRLRLSYRLEVAMAPAIAVEDTALFDGWPVSPATTTDGKISLQYVGLSAVQVDGTTTVFDEGGLSNEPSGVTDVASFLSPSSAALAAFSYTPPDRSVNASEQSVSLASYTSLSFTTTKESDFDQASANRSDLRSMGVGSTANGSAAKYSGLAFVFDEAQTKTVMESLSLEWSYSWNRVLTP